MQKVTHKLKGWKNFYNFKGSETQIHYLKSDKTQLLFDSSCKHIQKITVLNTSDLVLTSPADIFSEIL